jgi:hypothetical protein
MVNGNAFHQTALLLLLLHLHLQGLCNSTSSGSATI